MEAALLLGLLGYGAHQMIGHTDVVEEPQAVVETIDWTREGNFNHSDSPQSGIQWVFVTGSN